MAQVSYEAYTKRKEENSNRVKFFSLKNDGDEAIVRIMHDTMADLDIVVTHSVRIDNRWRNVNCLRTPDQPIAECPLCEANAPLRSKIFLHMIQYTKNADGTVSAVPVIWDRPANYIDRIKNLMGEYGALSDNIFKIKRNGAAGSMDTSYDIMYASPNVYQPSTYVKDTSLTANMKAIGTAVLNKSYDELVTLAGQIQSDDAAPAPVSSTTSVTPAPASVAAPAATMQSSAAESQPTAFTASQPVEDIRPRRYY